MDIHAQGTTETWHSKLDSNKWWHNQTTFENTKNRNRSMRVTHLPMALLPERMPLYLKIRIQNH